MSKRYVLEIYAIGSDTDVLESMESDHPFMAISAGDYFNCEETSNLGMGAVRVTGVEHIVWNSDIGPKHKACIYLEKRERPRR